MTAVMGHRLPTPETIKVRLDETQNNLVEQKMFLLTAGGLD